MTGFDKRVLAVRTPDGHNFVLLEPLKFTRPSGEIITVLQGATTDGVSSPRWTWAVVPPFGKAWLPGVLHDAAYRLQTRPLISERAVADALFLEALIYMAVEPVLATALYEAVHKFGEAAWIADRVPELGGS